MKERAQALVEAVVALPACLACAVALVDCGILVRDRLAVTQAATRAGEAQLVGSEPHDAARAGLPGALRRTLKVSVDGSTIVVTAQSSSRMAALAGRDITHRSTVEVAR